MWLDHIIDHYYIYKVPNLIRLARIPITGHPFREAIVCLWPLKEALETARTHVSKNAIARL